MGAVSQLVAFVMIVVKGKMSERKNLQRKKQKENHTRTGSPSTVTISTDHDLY